MTTIANAVKIATARNDVDGQWNRAELIGQRAADAHMKNENFACCSGHAARADYYAMWVPVYRKHAASVQ